MDARSVLVAQDDQGLVDQGRDVGHLVARGRQDGLEPKDAQEPDRFLNPPRSIFEKASSKMIKRIELANSPLSWMRYNWAKLAKTEM
jgi:hypothetical protein